jgi:hypothetical protein
MIQLKRRRASDRQPSRESFLQGLCDRQGEELLLLRAESSRLRTELARAKTALRDLQSIDTVPGGLYA